MKKFLKYTGMGVGAILVVCAILIAFYFESITETAEFFRTVVASFSEQVDGRDWPDVLKISIFVKEKRVVHSNKKVGRNKTQKGEIMKATQTAFEFLQ